MIFQNDIDQLKLLYRLLTGQPVQPSITGVDATFHPTGAPMMNKPATIGAAPPSTQPTIPFDGGVVPGPLAKALQNPLSAYKGNVSAHGITDPSSVRVNGLPQQQAQAVPRPNSRPTAPPVGGPDLSQIIGALPQSENPAQFAYNPQGSIMGADAPNPPTPPQLAGRELSSLPLMQGGSQFQAPHGNKLAALLRAILPGV